MTLLNMMEEVKQAFPSLSYTQIKLDINRAIREFGQITGLPYAEVTLNKTTSYVSFDDEKETYLWTLPSDVYEVRKIDTQYLDEIRLLNQNLYLAWLADDVENIRIEYVKVPSAVTADSDESNIPVVFHPAILARVQEKWYATSGNAPMAQYYRDIWKSGIREGKRYYWTRPWRNYSLANTTGAAAGGGGTTTQDKKRVSGRLAIVEGINTVNVGAPGATITMNDTDYVLMLNGNGIWVTAVNPDTQLIERTTTTFNVWSAADNANFEYIIEGE